MRLRVGLVYECDVKKAAEQDQHPNAPTKRYPIVCRHGNLADCVRVRSTSGMVGTMRRSRREKTRPDRIPGRFFY